MSPFFVPFLIFFLTAATATVVVKRFPPVLFLVVPTYSIVTKTASVAYLERRETFLIETRLVSLDTGATERTVFYNLVVLVTAYFLLKAFAVGIKRRNRLTEDQVLRIARSRELRFSIRLAAVLLAAQFANALLSYPYPIPGSGLSRQSFAQNLRFPFIDAAVGELVVFAPVIGAAAFGFGLLADIRVLRLRGIQLTVVHVSYLLLMGQRFNGGVLIGGIWLATLASVLWLGQKRISLSHLYRRLLPAVLALMLIGQVDLASRAFAQSADSPFEAITYRVFALQGGVSYSAEHRASRGERVDPALLVEDMSTTRSTYMPASLADAYERRGVNLAGSLHGNSVLSLGYFAAVFPLALYGAILAGASAVLLTALARGRTLALFPLSFLILRVISVNAQGTFASLLSPQTVVLVLATVLTFLGGSMRKPTYAVAPMRAKYSHTHAPV